MVCARLEPIISSRMTMIYHLQGTVSNFLASWSLLAVVLPLTLAHDVRPVDQDQTRFAALEEQDPQKVEEALLKLHFALLEDSRQKETGRQSYPVMNMSADISRNEFDYLVGRINEEVAVLRRQALILSKAYQSLLVKHKETTAKLDSVSSDPLGICANVTCKAPQGIDWVWFRLDELVLYNLFFSIPS